MKQERRGGIETPLGPGRRRGGAPKQERRGGIETVCCRPAQLPCSRKQERRGGIETGLPNRGPQGPPPRSRNAVVALKLVEHKYLYA